jgi:IS30 family transposase
MAEPIRERDREAVRRLHAEGKSRNQIARELGRGAATVSKNAAAEGLIFSGGARVAAATAALRADAAARRGARSSPTAPSLKSSGSPAPTRHATHATTPPPPAR